MSDNTPLLTVAVLLEELKEVDDWYLLGTYLNVPVRELKKIETTHTQDGVERSKLEMLQYWLDTTMTASWKDIARALEQLNMLTLAARLKLKYLRTSPTTTTDESSVQPSLPQPDYTNLPSADLSADVDPSIDPITNADHSTDSSINIDPSPNPSIDPSTKLSTDFSTAALAIVADVEVVGGLQDLESDFSNIFTDTRKDLAKCNVKEMRFFLADLFENEEFNECRTIEEVLRKLRMCGHVDTFNVYYLECLISRFHRSDAIMKSIEEYIKKKEKFLKTTTVQNFQQAVMSRAEAVRPKGMAEVTIKVPNISESNKRTMKDVEKLAKRAFKGRYKDLVRINVKPGSIVITWYVPECLCEELVQLAQENIGLLREDGVEEVSIVGEKSMTLSTKDGHEGNIPEITEQECAALKKGYGEFYHQLVDVLSDGDTHRSIVSDLHKRSMISEKVFTAQMTSTQERGRSLLTVLGLEEKPHKLRELITVMMEVKKVKSLAEEMTAQLSKSEQGNHIEQQQFEARINQLTSDKEVLLTQLQHCKEELKAANELLIMREKVISSMMAVDKGPKLGVKMNADTSLLTVAVLLEELKEVDNWYMLGAYLNVPVYQLNKIQSTHTQDGVERCKLAMLQYWLDNTMTASWNHIARALEQLNMLTLAARLKLKYLRTSPATTADGKRRKSLSDSDDDPESVPKIPKMSPKDQDPCTIHDVNRPYGVAVNNSGKVIVSEYWEHCISVYSREGEHIKSFGSKGSNKGQFKYPHGVAITSDNHILIADEYNYRIQMFTTEGRYLKSVGQQGKERHQFDRPSGIAVHPSGKVFVAEIRNNRIQVLNSDLSYSHMFGSKGSAPGKFSSPHGVAINSSGVVYVNDYDNHRVQLFSVDGQFISAFGSKGSQHGQLFHPFGICIDSSSTNTVYVTDSNHRVSVYANSGQFIKCFGTKGSGEGKFNSPDGVAVDNTTRALYVCDTVNNRVVVVKL